VSVDSVLEIYPIINSKDCTSYMFIVAE
jgi:hypothetical protein